MTDQYPYGECECRNGCACGENAGPALLQITRDGVTKNVCTMCTLSADTGRTSLAPRGADLAVFFRYDPLGVLVAQGWDDLLYPEVN